MATKADLRAAYEAWAREELESIYLIEAVGAYLKIPRDAGKITAPRLYDRPTNEPDPICGCWNCSNYRSEA